MNDIEQIEHNFRELHPAMNLAEARFEAHRCLYCFDAPCTRACPTHIDVPKFIKKIASGNVLGAARTIFDANPIGATCARVCPVDVLCEGACVEGTLMAKPIEIGRLQRYATDFAMSRGATLFTAGAANGKSVGIVGSGPAGLSCAAYLARLGYAVTIYDKKPLPGGLDAYGMAEYKMTQAVAVAEARRLEALGVVFKTNTEIVPNSGMSMQGVNALSWDDLEATHDALFLAVGLGATQRLGVPGEDLTGVYDALEFIEHIKTRDWLNVPKGRTVAVLGAGNTAIDAVTQAKRLGAERALLVYRRTSQEMPAYEYEYELAKQDGIEFHWLTSPVEIRPDATGERVGALRCVRMELSAPDERGRRTVREVPGSEHEIHCDMVIKALGQQKMKDLLSGVAGLQLDITGRIAVNPANMQTANPKYFAGGDCVNGGREAVDAAQHGKLAALGIHEMLLGERATFAGAGR